MSKIFSMNTLFLKNIDILLKDILNNFKYKQLLLQTAIFQENLSRRE